MDTQQLIAGCCRDNYVDNPGESVLPINLENEERKLEAERESAYDKLEIFTLRLTNKALSSRELHDIKKLIGRKFVVSRLMRNKEFSVPKTNTVLLEGDLLLVVAGTADVEPITVLSAKQPKQTGKSQNLPGIPAYSIDKK